MRHVIDVSDWNDNIDWEAVVNKGITGVIIKISEGRTLTDLYKTHLQNALHYGLDWGVYCFSHAQTSHEAEMEASVVVNELWKLELGYPPLGIWFDMEAPEVIYQAPEDVTAVASAFVTACNRYDFKAGIYASYSTLTYNMYINQLADYVPYWVAQYGSINNDFLLENPSKNVVGWQKSEEYLISGEYFDFSEWYE